MMRKALALSQHSSVHAEGILVDCMCGSGTFLIEAAIMAHNIAPGLFRESWMHHSWPDFDSRVWQDCAAAAKRDCRKSWRGVIAGCDREEVLQPYRSFYHLLDHRICGDTLMNAGKLSKSLPTNT
jgi:23S rRNA G2445 N2-methylase RlmL